MDIAGNLRQRGFPVHQITVVAPLEECPSPFMAAIEIGGIARPQALHDFAYVSPRRLQKKANLPADKKVAINLEPELALVPT